jgi:hypothetical protein
MKTLLLILSLLLITSNSYAEWTKYSVGEDYFVHFYDESTVKRNGDKIRVWKYTNYSPDDKEAKSINVSSTRSLDEIDCINETVKSLSRHSYTKPNLQGDMTDYTDPNPTISYIVPNSTLAVLMKLVCKK